MTRRYESWGRYPVARQEIRKPFWRADPLPELPPGKTILPHGLGRSYGDSCLNDGGVLLDTTALENFISFDRERGVLCCEAGVSLAAILDLIVPRGWFLPVTPGTKFVTVGGAIANDVHGKNHHRAGTFGRHVRRFELLRSDGRRLVCSREENEPLFRATIGGLGLTGLITWAEFSLKKIEGELIDFETVRFSGLEEFCRLTRESDETFEYTVAWVDCLAGGIDLGRGVFLRGNHAARSGQNLAVSPDRPRRLNVPLDLPGFALSPLAIKSFNRIYYRRHAGQRRRLVHHERFFYPLDSISNWNRLYGRRGLLQYQCVVPDWENLGPIRKVFTRISDAGQGSFLAVLKVFGDLRSPGLLSFPSPGITLALDFPNRGPKVLDLLEELDDIVRQHGGRVYPAKDARMSSKSFESYFPQWREFARYIDPRFSSSFWRRVTDASATEGLPT